MKRGLQLMALASALLAVNRLIQQAKPEMDLNGQVVLITGGTRGLGFLLAQELARKGCKIVVCGRDEASVELARTKLREYTPGVMAEQCDASDRTQIEQVVEKTIRRFGQIDILINCAAIIQVGPVETQTVLDFEQAMDAIYWSMVYATFAVLPHMRRRECGRIVNITSIGGKVSIPHLLPYSAAKFAATGFSEGLRSELLKDNILVTTIAPGLMRTGSHLNAQFKGDQESEFMWFSLSDTLPISSISAEQAAFEIIQALKRGEAQRVLSLPAKIAAKFHGLYPGMTSNILGFVNLLLPSARNTASGAVPGFKVHGRIDSSLLTGFTEMGIQAARRLNQFSKSWEEKEIS